MSIASVHRNICLPKGLTDFIWFYRRVDSHAE